MYKYKDYCADSLIGSFRVALWRYIVFQRKLLSLHNPQGNFKKHTEKDSVFAVGSVSQFWKNCNYTGDNVHERLRSAWAWFRFTCKVFQSRESITWIRPRFLCILSYRYPVSHLSALWKVVRIRAPLPPYSFSTGSHKSFSIISCNIHMVIE